MEQRRLRELYAQSLHMNRETFSAGEYDMAYHALVFALHCSERLKDTNRLAEIANPAQEECRYVDEYHPEYTHSSKSAAARGNLSVFRTAALQAKAKLLQIETG